MKLLFETFFGLWLPLWLCSFWLFSFWLLFREYTIYYNLSKQSLYKAFREPKYRSYTQNNRKSYYYVTKSGQTQNTVCYVTESAQSEHIFFFVFLNSHSFYLNLF